MAEKSFIEDAIDGFTIVDATIGFADDTSPRGGHFMFGHLGAGSRQAPRMGVKESLTFGRWASGGGWSAVYLMHFGRETRDHASHLSRRRLPS